MTLQISFDCCLCEFNADSEEKINYHYLWIHNKWRGNCESPNKINTQSEADNIVKHITHELKNKPLWKKEQLNYYELRECMGLLQRLDELNWAKPKILYRNNKISKRLLDEYQRFGKNNRIYKTCYKYSKEGAIKQRDYEDKMEENENTVKRLVKEIDEEIKKQKEYEDKMQGKTINDFTR